MKRYHPALVVLHWLLAVLIIGALIMGGQILAKTPNADPSKMLGLKMHMSIGIVILLLTITRLIVRFKTKKPPHADIGNALLNKGASVAHMVLYPLVIAMGVSGLATANAVGLPAIVFFGSGDPLPLNFDDLLPRAAHGALSIVLMLVIVSHVLAALYHQFIRKDGLLSRMWFGER